jgi:hypothetical protein
MKFNHNFTSELTSFVSYYDYCTSKLTGEDLYDFVFGQAENEGNASEEHNIKYSNLYAEWLKEYKITHTISDENNQVIQTNTYLEQPEY